ncbi:YtxH domain-containing protein [Mesobacillus jeotgali]|uniref:YtxH domain-containing protein n=1 Tax=Mesobacillus jeotgali TaxID=129985 RepID=A0ABY9VII7_9BACI|nr:YtxH domain-containing protein [Mesobacillus jeotgali]WNF23739.1 YtxH domain-containing protein [Mesobacillus jeotgali]
MSDNILSNNQTGNTSNYNMNNNMYSSSTENATYDTTTGTTTYASTNSGDSYSNNSSMGGYSSSYAVDNSNSTGSSNSKLMKGVLIGAAIGGALTLLDSNTRTKVKDKAVNAKDTSMNVFSEVKNNPTDVKEQMMSSFKEASSILKEAISDAQNLYQRLNDDVFSKMNEAKSNSSDAMQTVMNAKDELKEVGSKVKEAGSTAMDNPVVNSATESNSSYSGSNGSADAYATGMESKPSDTTGLGNTSNAFTVSPENQKNDNNR